MRFYGSQFTMQPYAFSMTDDKPFAFAGPWDAWKDPAQDQWLQSFTTITTTTRA
jgi:putative SOS response-associated peptidase YedK